MAKVNYIQFKNSLANLGKSFFTLSELKKFYPHDSRSIEPLLNRLTETGAITRLGKGYYAFELSRVDYLQLACQLRTLSYISFEYALHYYGLINQVPSVITLASQGEHRFIGMGVYTFEYSYLKKDLFWGYVLEKGIYVAEPEKALLDLVYLIARGKRLADLDSLEVQKFDKKKIQKYLKKFPGYVGLKAQEVFEMADWGG